MMHYVIVIAMCAVSMMNYVHAKTTLCFSVSDPQTDVDSVLYIFAHGLAATHRQAFLLFSHLASECVELPHYNKHWIVKNPLVVFDFYDAKSDNDINWHRQWVNLGQELDIATLKGAYEYARKMHENRAIILAGVSRGASTIINYVALHKPLAIKALVLESPFDTLANVISHLLRQYHLKWIPFSYTLASKYMSTIFPLLNVNGIVPYDLVDRIPFDLPVLLIHAKKDKTVPIAASRSLYLKLVQAGHKQVHLLELATGEHARLTRGPEAELYHNVVQAFYKRYGLPHEEAAARQGDALFHYCQPSLQDVAMRLKPKRSAINNQDDVLLYNRDTILQV